LPLTTDGHRFFNAKAQSRKDAKNTAGLTTKYTKAFLKHRWTAEARPAVPVNPSTLRSAATEDGQAGKPALHGAAAACPCEVRKGTAKMAVPLPGPAVV